MQEKMFNFEKVFIKNEIKNHFKTSLILEKLNLFEKIEDKIEYFDDINKLIKDFQPAYKIENRNKILVLSSIRGEVLRKCPGTHGHICCNYNIINQYIGCSLDCSYCILQGYLNVPFTIINVDIEIILKELEKQKNNHIIRIGTGELGDSLLYDHLTDFSIDLINFFKDNKQYIFEFKTKTVNINNLLKFENPGNIVIGFSVNPEVFRKTDEIKSATIEERIEAMKKLVNNKYKIALHFDPIVNINNYFYEYNNLVDNIFKAISPDDIAWISLGTFRFNNELKNMIQYNHRNSKILLDEFVLCQDNKYRYFRPIRVKLYKTVKDALERYSKKMPVYLCMESNEVWNDIFGNIFDNKESDYKASHMDLLFNKSGRIVNNK